MNCSKIFASSCTYVFDVLRALISMYHKLSSRPKGYIKVRGRTYAPCALLNVADSGRVAVHASDGQPISRREKASRNVACVQTGAREEQMRGEDDGSTGIERRGEREGKRDVGSRSIAARGRSCSPSDGAAPVASEPADWSREMMAGALANRLPAVRTERSTSVGYGPHSVPR